MIPAIPNEIKKNPEAQGAHILKSYLSALKIPHEAGAKCNEVKVQSARGGVVTVVVGAGEAQIKLDAESITSYELPKALGALHLVTEAAGYGKPQPVDRGVAPAGRVNYLDNYEDVYLRHSTFRRSPNKTEADLAPYMKVIKGCARRALHRWRKVWQAMGFGENDLVNIGMVHTITFLHLYSYAEQEIDNIKLLTSFLNQRLGEDAKTTYKKALNATCLPQAVQSSAMIANGGDEETSYIDVFAESAEASPDEEYDEEDKFELIYSDGKVRILRVVNDGFMGLDMCLDGAWLSKLAAKDLTENIRNGQIQKRPIEVAADVVEETESQIKARKDNARTELVDRLKAMDLEHRTVILGYAAMSRDYSPDARREARKLCDELVCPQCKRRVPSGAHCPTCEVVAVPLLGVDFMAFRDKLTAEQHTMAEAMSAQIPESEMRNRAKRPAVEVGTIALADSGETPKIVKIVPKMTKVEMSDLSKKMADELMATLPQQAVCPRCKKNKDRKEFGIRVAKDKATGLPCRASRQSYCKPCRKP